MSISRVYPPSKAEPKSKLRNYTSLLGNSRSGKYKPPEAKGSYLVAWERGSNTGNMSGSRKATREAQVRLETREAQVKTAKEM
jgi:hypothetical protein